MKRNRPSYLNSIRKVSNPCEKSIIGLIFNKLFTIIFEYKQKIKRRKGGRFVSKEETEERK